jgi:hypothetical protein
MPSALCSTIARIYRVRLMPSRLQRPVRDLVAASDDLLYEIERFFDCWFLLSERWSELMSLGTAFEEAVGVAFLVHGRSLADVFFPNRPRRDDVIAADFFPNPGTWKFAGSFSEQVRSIHRWVGRDVAHVSYGRLGRGDDRRDTLLIYALIRRATLAFVDAVPANVVSEHFSTGVRAAARLPAAEGADIQRHMPTSPTT